MNELLHAKLFQHSDVESQLKKTGNRTIIEQSPKGTFWSIGLDGKGDNNMGKLWMKLRDEIK